ncbi:hypothetical protein NP493_1918g00000 [Ridgeia piscesae]|uniref:SEA domain-containing protein n=1 Tax=Ridgeia piscesae TaxID=27915 RepID=A0AAD9N4P6_RIDPI|nr:hypothetical protein NP493_1918g00000 [Ridgeia piscesae]
MKGLTNDFQNKSKLSERQNIYGYINYIKDEIENSNELITKPAIQLAPFAVTYDVKVKLPQENFVSEMRDTDSADFKHMQKKYCDAMTKVFDGIRVKCMVYQLSNGSVEVVSSLHFLWNKLKDLVDDTASEKIYAYIQTTIESSNVDFLHDSLVSTEEMPETAKYIVELQLKGMSWENDLSYSNSSTYKNKQRDYCEAMKQTFSDTMTGCEVYNFGKGDYSIFIDGYLYFNTPKMKEKAKAKGESVDWGNLRSIVHNELKKAANKTTFFNDMDVENIRVELQQAY